MCAATVGGERYPCPAPGAAPRVLPAPPEGLAVKHWRSTGTRSTFDCLDPALCGVRFHYSGTDAQCRRTTSPPVGPAGLYAGQPSDTATIGGYPFRGHIRAGETPEGDRGGVWFASSPDHTFLVLSVDDTFVTQSTIPGDDDQRPTLMLTREVEGSGRMWIVSIGGDGLVIETVVDANNPNLDDGEDHFVGLIGDGAARLLSDGSEVVVDIEHVESIRRAAVTGPHHLDLIHHEQVTISTAETIFGRGLSGAERRWVQWVVAEERNRRRAVAVLERNGRHDAARRLAGTLDDTHWFDALRNEQIDPATCDIWDAP